MSMAAGDGAVLGRIFAHLHSRTQIDAFLSAVQEVRASRVQPVVRASLGNIFAVALPPGIAEAHDRALRERAERGIASLPGAGEGGKAPTSEEMVQAIEGIFAYDAEDEADNWWMRWGLPAERAERKFTPGELEVERKEERY